LDYTFFPLGHAENRYKAQLRFLVKVMWRCCMTSAWFFEGCKVKTLVHYQASFTLP